MTDYEKQCRKVKNSTQKNMRSLGTYRKEFDAVILRYAQMKVQFDKLCERWEEEGFIITEPYTNKSGATNERKTALYTAIEKLRAELTDIESILGMTPKGLKAIKKKGLDQKKESALDKMLDKK